MNLTRTVFFQIFKFIELLLLVNFPFDSAAVRPDLNMAVGRWQDRSVKVRHLDQADGLEPLARL